MILVPGLAFTIEGHRLGRGKGIYDRYLARATHSSLKRPLLIALAFKEQLLKEIPTFPTDFVLDKVLTN